MTTITTTFAQALQALRAHPAADSTDIQAVIKGKGKFGYTEQVHGVFLQYGIDPLDVFSLPQKAVKRAVQFGYAVALGNYRDIDATSACGIYALHLAPGNALDYDTLHFLIAGIARTEGAGGDTKGVQRFKLARLFSRVGANTVGTQKSRTFGDSGFAQALGMTFAPVRTKGRTVTLNTAHPLVQKFVALVEGATDAQIDQIGGKGE